MLIEGIRKKRLSAQHSVQVQAKFSYSALALAVSGALCAGLPANAAESWSYTYNSFGQVLAADGPRSDVSDITTNTYDASGNLASITNALGHITQMQDYNGRGQPGTIIDPNGVTTELTYHVRGWLLTSTVKDPGGNSALDAVTTYGYDNVGQATSVTLPDGSVINYEYDGAHRLTAITNNLNERMEYTLDAAGNRTLEVIKDSGGALVKTQTRIYDELSRLLQIVGANNQTVSYSYDANGNVAVVTDGKLQDTSNAYDVLDRLVSETDPDSYSIGYTYNSQDRIKTVTDQRGLITTYNYNGLGYLTSLISPDTGTITYTYDNAGNRITSTDARGAVANYSYDALNRLTTVAYPLNPSEDVSYSYDDTSNGNYGKGRLTGIADESGSIGFSYDHRGNLVGKTYSIDGAGYALGYAYDLGNNVIQIAYPSGRLVNYIRDSQGRITSITTQENSGAAAETIVSNVTYLPFGPVKSFTYGNGMVQTLAYDQDYRIVDNTAQGTGSALDLNYSYDANDNVAAIADQDNAANSQSFQYDNVDRLVQADGSYGQIDYQYDGVGNRTLRTHTQGSDITTDTYTYDTTSNRLNQVERNDGAIQTQRSFQYDAGGNLIKDTKDDGTVHDFVYNEANRMVELDRNTSLRATYLYNVFGQRTAKVAVGNSTISDHYHYDEAGQLFAVTTENGIAKREYIYLGTIKVAALVDDAFADEWENFDSQSPANTPPVVVNDSASTDEDQALVIAFATLTANDSDADNDALAITAVGSAGNGSVTLDAIAKTITFTPTADYHGAASFTYTLSDGTDTAIATVAVTVAPVNDAPLAVGDSEVTDQNQDLILNASALLANDTDVDLDTLAVTAVGNAVNGAVSLNAGAITFTPTSGFTGSASFDYTLSDGNATDTGTVTVTVQAVGTDPDGDGVPNSSDNCPSDANPNQTDADSDGIGNVCDPIALTVTSIGTEDGWLREASENSDVGGSVNNSSGGTGALRMGDFDDRRQFKGMVSFDLSALPADSTVHDATLTLIRESDAIVGNIAGFGALSVDLKVGVFNDNAALENEDFEATPTEANVATVTDGLTATAIINSTGIAALQTGHNQGQDKVQLRLQYALDDNDDSVSDYLGYYSASTSSSGRHPALTITYTLPDGSGGGSSNNPPVAVDDSDSTDEDQVLMVSAATLLANDTDADSDTLSITAVSNPSNGSVSLDGGIITFTPTADFTGSAGFDYTLSDGVDTDTGAVAVSVNAVNDAPVAVDDSDSTAEDQALIITPASLLANDTDIENDALSITAVGNPINGSVILDQGVITFSPTADFNGSASFVYTLSDGAATDTGTVTVSVSGVNDAPVALADSLEITQDQAEVIPHSALLANDSDADNDGLSITAVSNAVNGSATLNANDVTFTPSAGYTGAAGFDYTLSDGTTAVTGSVTLTVQAAGADADSDGIPNASDNCPNDANPNQSDEDSDGIGNVCDTEELIVTSIGTEDGWLRESAENSDVGGTFNNTSGGDGALRIGDFADQRQFKGLVSFDLSAMPSGSTLLDATLELNRETDSMVGDPYDLGDITVDLKTGGFNDNTAMENADFEAAPTQANVATLVDGQPATAAINSAGITAIQTALGQSESKVQLRLQYTVDDNNNSTSDYQGYYSASTSTGGRHPALIIHYTLAD